MRWQEIKIRQHRLLSEADHVSPGHIEQMIKSGGFTMNDLKGLQRGMSEDGPESDEMGRPGFPSRPPRRPSVSRTTGYEAADAAGLFLSDLWI
jgi:ryanodine receptor 2